MTDPAILAQMQKIRAKWGQLIGEACRSSSVPEAFLAALVGNESGGDPNAKRFEGTVLVSLWNVLMSRQLSYNGITRTELAIALVASPGPVVAATLLAAIDALASSHGLTQIMGYNAILLGSDPSHMPDLDEPTINLHTAITLLARFAHSFDLDLATEHEQLFRCWNTGRPDGKTFDPDYVPNGMARMAAYQ